MVSRRFCRNAPRADLAKAKGRNYGVVLAETQMAAGYGDRAGCTGSSRLELSRRLGSMIPRDVLRALASETSVGLSIASALGVPELAS